MGHPQSFTTLGASGLAVFGTWGGLWNIAPQRISLHRETKSPRSRKSRDLGHPNYVV